MTPQPSEQPRTAAGRALLDSLPLNEWHPINREIVIDHILAIEAEAAAPDPVASPAPPLHGRIVGPPDTLGYECGTADPDCGRSGCPIHLPRRTPPSIQPRTDRIFEERNAPQRVRRCTTHHACNCREWAAMQFWADASAPDPEATPPESFADALTEHSKERHHPEYGCRTTCAPDILARLPEVPALVGRTDEHMEALRE